MATTDPTPVTATPAPQTATATLVSGAAPLLPVTLPAAEAGNTTSEFLAVKMFGIISGGAFTIFAGAVSAHLVAIAPETLAWIGSTIAGINGVLIAVYTAARNARKTGTPG